MINAENSDLYKVHRLSTGQMDGDVVTGEVTESNSIRAISYACIKIPIRGCTSFIDLNDCSCPNASGFALQPFVDSCSSTRDSEFF